MIKKRMFSAQGALDAARAGQLKGADLRKAIKRADELGKTQIANELQTYLEQAASFADDAAPEGMRDRVAKCISALMAMGERLNRTRQMLRQRGVIDALNRIAGLPKSTKNFDKLVAAKLEHLTAEAIVLDYPDFFDPKTLEVARRRLKGSDPSNK